MRLTFWFWNEQQGSFKFVVRHRCKNGKTQNENCHHSQEKPTDRDNCVRSSDVTIAHVQSSRVHGYDLSVFYPTVVHLQMTTRHLEEQHGQMVSVWRLYRTGAWTNVSNKTLTRRNAFFWRLTKPFHVFFEGKPFNLSPVENAAFWMRLSRVLIYHSDQPRTTVDQESTFMTCAVNHGALSTKLHSLPDKAVWSMHVNRTTCKRKGRNPRFTVLRCASESQWNCRNCIAAVTCPRSPSPTISNGHFDDISTCSSYTPGARIILSYLWLKKKCHFSPGFALCFSCPGRKSRCCKNAWATQLQSLWHVLTRWHRKGHISEFQIRSFYQHAEFCVLSFFSTFPSNWLDLALCKEKSIICQNLVGF